MTVSNRRRTFADNVLHSGFVELIAHNRTYFNECVLTIGVIVCNQIGAGKIELFGIVFQNAGQLRDQLGQFDGFPYLVLSDAEKFSDQCPGGIPRARIA